MPAIRRGLARFKDEARVSHKQIRTHQNLEKIALDTTKFWCRPNSLCCLGLKRSGAGAQDCAPAGIFQTFGLRQLFGNLIPCGPEIHPASGPGIGRALKGAFKCRIHRAAVIGPKAHDGGKQFGNAQHDVSLGVIVTRIIRLEGAVLEFDN